MSTQIQIAKTIAAQIGGRTMMALGATKLTALSEGPDRVGGLQFDCSLFGSAKCRVVVVLTGADLYNLQVLYPRNGKVFQTGAEIFCEEISGEVEMAVEKFFAAKRA